MAWIVEDVIDDIISELETSLPAYDIFEGAYPSAETVITDKAGAIKNYIVFQFSDLRFSRPGSFTGVRSDEFFLVMDVQVVSGVARHARQIRNKVNDVLLGYKPAKGSGQMFKEWSISDYFITDPKQKPQAYVAAASFRVSLQAETL